MLMLLVVYGRELAYFYPRIHIYDIEQVIFSNYMGIYFVTGHISFSPRVMKHSIFKKICQRKFAHIICPKIVTALDKRIVYS